MKTFVKQIDIQASAQTIWEVMMDVENWNLWTSTIIKMKKLTGPELKVGSRVLIEQLNLPRATWKITDLQPEKGFSMAKQEFFLKVVASHTIEKIARCHRVTLSLQFSGILTNWVADKYGAMMQAYLETEASGLKAVCEKLEENRLGKAS